ncbi:hypothetical protein CapIbe_007580 [Capra ibex]
MADFSGYASSVQVIRTFQRFQYENTHQETPRMRYNMQNFLKLLHCEMLVCAAFGRHSCSEENPLGNIDLI